MNLSVIQNLGNAADDVMDAEFALSEKRRVRDALIVEAHAGGASLRSIGDACMISHQTVKNILDASRARDHHDTRPAR